MHGHETTEKNSHEVKVHFESMTDTLKTGRVGNQETSSPSSNSEKVDNEPKNVPLDKFSNHENK